MPMPGGGKYCFFEKKKWSSAQFEGSRYIMLAIYLPLKRDSLPYHIISHPKLANYPAWIKYKERGM